MSTLFVLMLATGLHERADFQSAVAATFSLTFVSDLEMCQSCAVQIDAVVLAMVHSESTPLQRPENSRFKSEFHISVHMVSNITVSMDETNSFDFYAQSLVGLTCGGRYCREGC